MGKHLFAVAVYIVFWCMAAVLPQKTVVTLYTTSNCPHCETLKKTLAKMPEIEVKEVSEAIPKKLYPQLTMPGRDPLVGAVKEQRVRDWIQGK